MKFGKAVLGQALFAKLMKLSFYGHFVAGENRQAIKPVIHRMHSFGVKSILDYSVEEDISEQEASSREMECVRLVLFILFILFILDELNPLEIPNFKLNFAVHALRTQRIRLIA